MQHWGYLSSSWEQLCRGKKTTIFCPCLNGSLGIRHPCRNSAVDCQSNFQRTSQNMSFRPVTSHKSIRTGSVILECCFNETKKINTFYWSWRLAENMLIDNHIKDCKKRSKTFLIIELISIFIHNSYQLLLNLSSLISLFPPLKDVKCIWLLSEILMDSEDGHSSHVIWALNASSSQTLLHWS